MITRPLLTVLTMLCFISAALAPVAASAHDPQDVVLEQIGVDEKLGRPIPLELPFSDENGQPVQLSRFFTGAPVILTLNYYSCPTLCPLVLRNLVTAIGGMGNLELGKDFRVVTVSIDPDETLQMAADKAGKTYAMLGPIPDPRSAWPFLVGKQSSIQPLARSVGVRYTRLKSGEIAHPNVVIIITPEGRISRYLYGIEQAPKDLKLALLEASGGEIGSSKLVNRALLYCFHYDPVGKKYVLLASRVMTGAMVGVLVLTLALLAMLWKRERPSHKGEGTP